MSLRSQPLSLVPDDTARVAHAVLRFSKKSKAAPTRWAAGLLTRKPCDLVAVALANKMARIAWALMTTGKRFEASAA